MAHYRDNNLLRQKGLKMLFSLGKWKQNRRRIVVKFYGRTVHAEIITEKILERAGPAIFQNFLLEFKSFQTDSRHLSCKKSKAWKLLQTIINSRRAYLQI